MFRLVLILGLVLACNSPVQSVPNNQPWGDTWKGIKQLEVNDSVNSFFGPNDMTWADGFRFYLQADGKIRLTAQGPGKRFGYTIEIPGYANDSKSRNKNPAVWSHADLEAGEYSVMVLWHDNVKAGPIPTTTYNLSLSYSC
jgi:hypothetical protein